MKLLKGKHSNSSNKVKYFIGFMFTAAFLTFAALILLMKINAAEQTFGTLGKLSFSRELTVEGKDTEDLAHIIRFHPLNKIANNTKSLISKEKMHNKEDRDHEINENEKDGKEAASLTSNKEKSEEKVQVPSKTIEKNAEKTDRKKAGTNSENSKSRNQKNTQPKNNPTILNDFEKEIINLTNQERKKHGLQLLKIDYQLSNTARLKSEDMSINQYFSHTSPTYGSPFQMLDKFGISYKYAGENLAYGYPAPEIAMKAWMDSEGHRKNILNPNFTHIGVGYAEKGKYWTQHFIQK